MNDESILKRIIDFICREMDVPLAAIQSNTQIGDVVLPRQMIHFFADKMTGLDNKSIGRMVGRKDRNTVRHSLKVINNRIDTDRSFSEKMNGLEKRISSVMMDEHTLRDLIDYHKLQLDVFTNAITQLEKEKYIDELGHA